MLTRCMLALMLGVMTFSILGCEAKGKIDDDEVKVQVKDK